MIFLINSRSLLLSSACLLFAGQPLLAATFNLTISSANGGADSLFSWSYTGTPTIASMSVYGIGWGSMAYAGGPVVTGSNNAAYDSPGLATITGFDLGLSLTNTTTGVSGQLTNVEFDHYGNFAYMGFAMAGGGASGVPANPGEVIVLSGPTSGSFLSGISFDNFNEGQWTFDMSSYQNFDPVLTVGVAPIPEPSTYGLIMGGLTLATVAARRRPKASK